MQNERPEAVAISKAIWKSVRLAFLNDAGPEYDEIGEMLAIPHVEAALAAARAAQCEYICKCGLRVEPHRCRDTKGDF